MVKARPHKASQSQLTKFGFTVTSNIKATKKQSQLLSSPLISIKNSVVKHASKNTIAAPNISIKQIQRNKKRAKRKEARRKAKIIHIPEQLAALDNPIREDLQSNNSKRLQLSGLRATYFPVIERRKRKRAAKKARQQAKKFQSQ